MLADVAPVFIPILFGVSSLIQMYSVMPASMSDLCVCKVPPAQVVPYSCKDKRNLIFVTSVCHQVATGFLSLMYIFVLCKFIHKGFTTCILLSVFLAVIIPTALLCTDLNQPETSVCNKDDGEDYAEAKDLMKIGFGTSALFVAGTSIALVLIVWNMKVETVKEQTPAAAVQPSPDSLRGGR